MNPRLSAILDRLKHLRPGRAVASPRHEVDQAIELTPDIEADIVRRVGAELQTLASEVDDFDSFAVLREVALSKARELGASGFIASADDREMAITRRYIDELPEPGRTFFMHSLDGKPYTEIAWIMRTDERIVLQALTRAYSGLRMRLLPDE